MLRMCACSVCMYVVYVCIACMYVCIVMYVGYGVSVCYAMYEYSGMFLYLVCMYAVL